MSALAITGLSVAYGLVAVAAMRPITGHIAWTFARNGVGRFRCRDCGKARPETRPSGDQWFGAGLIAFFVVLVWPLAIAWLWADRTLPTIGNERKTRRDVDRARIAELERELGIGT